MALGKNLKKKKLISDEPEKAKPKKAKVAQKPIKKDLISKPKKKSKVKKQSVKVTKKEVKSVAKEVKEESIIPIEQQQASIDPVLTMYITNELKERKTLLRAQYAELINSIQDKTIQFISIQIGDELYAIDIGQVKEIVPIPHLSKTPNTPSHIRGIANVRGKNYTVFDLAIRFKIEDEKTPQFLLLLNNREVKAGLILPLLPSTFKVSGKFISSELNMIEDASLDVSYIKGLIQYDEKLIYYLDIKEMLINDKAIVIPGEMTNTK
ncbi:MAG: chemotaxis protein CheW [Ekhidna sp.]